MVSRLTRHERPEKGVFRYPLRLSTQRAFETTRRQTGRRPAQLNKTVRVCYTVGFPYGLVLRAYVTIESGINSGGLLEAFGLLEEKSF